MALDVDFSGQYRVRGYYIDKENIGSTTAAKVDGNAGTTPTAYDRSYMDMRFRLQTVFKVNENISVTTRFDALDNTKFGDKWAGYGGSYAPWDNTKTPDAVGTKPDQYPDDQANVTFDRAYATIKTPIGGFLFGRMKDASWGTSFGDTEGNGDRLVYVVPVKNWIFAGVWEKWHEMDGDANNLNIQGGKFATLYGSDQDNEKFFLSGTYRSEAFTAGLLYGYYRFNNFLDYGDEAHYQVMKGLGTKDLFRRPVKGTANLLSPYITGKWGDFELQAEGTYAFGTADYIYNNQLALPAANQASMKNNGKSKDLLMSQYMLDATYHIGPISINGGYAYQSGDVKYRSTEDKATGFGFLEQGGDWHKMWILNGGNRHQDDNGMYQTLGGAWQAIPGVASSYEQMGNLSNYQTQVSVNGFKNYWLGVDYAIMDNMTLGALVGKSEADKVMDIAGGPKWEKDHGIEYDVNFMWDVYENLTWRITYAYLKAGDYWKQGNANAQLKDPYTFYTNIAVNF
jgi:hypothetical protein